jgi:hypothetical protein
VSVLDWLTIRNTIVMRICLVLTVVLVATSALRGQTAQPQNACANSDKLGCLIPNLYGAGGFTLPNPFHAAHFTNAFQENFTPLSSAVATQLTLLPLASPASGFTFTFDPTTGAYTRTAESFGPILTERAETVGRGRFHLGFTYQRFNFDQIDGVDLDNIPAVFQHLRETGADYENDFITTSNSIDLKVSQFTFLGTIGVTNWFDVSVAVPVLDVSMKVASDATIRRTAPPHPEFCPPNVPTCTGEAHYFDPANQVSSINRVFTDQGSAAGISDITLRFKATALRRGRAALAIATDLRLPTGDERNYLGSGTYGVRPFAAFSVRGRVAPHFNLGYGINGSSLLSGDIAANRRGHLPNNLFYSAGADIGATRVLTLAFDLLGIRVFKGQRVTNAQFTATQPELSNPGAGRQSYPDIHLQNQSFNITNAAAGFKVNLAGRLLATANLLIRLDDGGLVARVTPLFGLSYTF